MRAMQRHGEGGVYVNKALLADHVRLCRRNLRSRRVKCCARCPFEDEIVDAYPKLRALFVAKRDAQRVFGRRSKGG